MKKIMRWPQQRVQRLFTAALATIFRDRARPIENRSPAPRPSCFHPFSRAALIALVVLVGANQAEADISVPDRRRNQFPDTQAHLVVPLPYSYPGIGDGFFLMGNLSNIGGTTTDFLAMYVAGDAGGHILQLDEAPIIDQRLFARLFYQNINKAVVNQYDTRGMDNTGKYDYTLIEATLAMQKAAEINLTFHDRRLNFYYQRSAHETKVKAIRDHNGGLIRSLDKPYHNESTEDSFGINVDLTDDFQDPLKGLRFSLHYQNYPAKEPADPSFYVTTHNLLYYMPLRESDTLVLNYFQSDAHVKKKGNTSAADVRQELGLNCDALDSQCLSSEQKLVDSIIKDRTNGSSESLGGKERLRSYPQGRFQGGHSAFLGFEYRLNFKQEVVPFNYLFWKDVRTGVQVAFFGEAGTVSETYGDLWKEKRYSYGTGVRLVTASGAVYRADIANGSEGNELTVFFMYPW